MANLNNFFQAIKHIFRNAGLRTNQVCPICKTTALYLDSVDFNKSCEEARGKFLPLSGILVHYYLCDQCGFCFAPELASWTLDDFSEKIYNEGYEGVDPDYKLARPHSNATMVQEFFARGKNDIRHLDYGGGSGLLSEVLRNQGWNSQSYDPFVNTDMSVNNLGQFDLVTAFEVFEHVPDIDTLLQELSQLCKNDGLILFSTFLSDGYINRDSKLTWWYASPRNGHISLFSAKSLAMRLNQDGFHLVSFDANFHMAFRQLPNWAKHLVKLV